MTDSDIVELAPCPFCGNERRPRVWCREEASGIARAWREGVEFGHDVAAVWAEAV